MVERHDFFTEPSEHFLTGLRDDSRRRARLWGSVPDPGPAFSGAPETVHTAVDAVVERIAPDLREILHELHAHPEVAFTEHRAQAAITELLARHDWVARRGVHGLETAFRAEWSTPGVDPRDHPRIAILAEYDALPGLGHACGHNVIAAAGIGAALALREVMAAQQIPGTLVLLGTPAEEGRTGKEHMAREGAFAGLDAALMVHPFGADHADQVWLGRRVATASYLGRSAHASAQPYQGRNALDAVSLAYQGIGLLRQQMTPADRVHAVIAEGGTRASIIPDRAVLDLYVRSQQTATLLELSRRIENVLRGAALMTETTLDLGWDADPPSLPVRGNAALTARWTSAQQRRGRSPLPPEAVPSETAASTDFGNVSHLVPGIHPVIAIADPETALHTEAFERAAASPRAESAALDAAAGLASVALDLLADPALRAAAHREFAEAGGVVSVSEQFG